MLPGPGRMLSSLQYFLARIEAVRTLKTFISELRKHQRVGFPGSLLGCSPKVHSLYHLHWTHSEPWRICWNQMFPLESLFLYLQEQLLKSVATIFHIDGKSPNAVEDGKRLWKWRCYRYHQYSCFFPCTHSSLGLHYFAVASTHLSISYRRWTWTLQYQLEKTGVNIPMSPLSFP